jgi:hypothetical protein
MAMPSALPNGGGSGLWEKPLEAVLGLQANLKETSIVKIACGVEATRIRSCS